MAVTQQANVIRPGADQDVVAGPVRICGIKTVAGGTACTFSLTVGSVVVWEHSQATVTDSFEHVHIHAGGGESLTLGMSGTGAKIFLYTE
jgi:hypothetical protein